MKPDGEGFALAIRSLFQLSLQDGSPDQLLLGPIAKLAGRNAGFTLDSFLLRDLNSSSITQLDIKWQAKHRLSDRMSFGVEGYGKIADLQSPGSFEDQEHRAGPVIYLKLGPWSGKQVRDVAGVGEGTSGAPPSGRCSGSRSYLRRRLQVQPLRRVLGRITMPKIRTNLRGRD